MELATIASRTRPLNNFLWAFLQVELVCFSFPDAGKVLTQDHFKMLNAFSVISRVLRSCSNRMGFIHLQLTSTFVLSPPAHNYYMVMVKTCLILKDSLIQLSLMYITFLKNISRGNVMQTNICSTCSCSYPEGTECLRCQQNTEYEESLRADQFKLTS